MPGPVSFGYGETVQHIAYVGVTKDDDGYQTTGYADPVEIPNVGVDYSEDAEEPRDGTTQNYQQGVLLFLPPGFTSNTKDIFVVRGKKYEAVGPGIGLRNIFTGDLYNTEVKAVTYDGS